MEFLDISSLGATYLYVVKIENKLSTKTSENLGLQIHNNQSMVKATLIHRIDNLKTTSPSCREIRAMRR
jgi:hypothetical protein